MPTIIAHAVVGAGIYRGIAGPGDGGRAGIWTAAALAMLPDIDVVGWNHVEYECALWHRGITHSLPFAVALGACAAFALRNRVRHWGGAWMLAANLALVTASHGVLDACTDGGSGVAFLLPFVAERTHFASTPIPVSPISIDPTNRRLRWVLLIETLLLWPPAFLVWTARIAISPWVRALLVAATAGSVWLWFHR